MIINPNWDRWIFASASIHFKDRILPTYPYAIEGQHNITQGSFIEYRSDGPKWIQMSRNCYRGIVTIDLLIRATQDSKDFHKIYRMLGLVESSFINCIPVRRYGNPIDDPINDSSLLSNLIRDSDITASNFGQLDPAIPLIEATVQANYMIEIYS